MVVYIDPPRWPAHGTHFSHMVSDHSYMELHALAHSIGVPPRAFDHDHYDVPQRLYDAAISAGALPVTGGDLIRILRKSGLRVPSKERAERVLPILAERWHETGIDDLSIRDDLLERWSEPHRHYHSPVHLLETLNSVNELAHHEAGEGTRLALLLAAWFHDAIYDGVPGEDEGRSADLAKQVLGGPLGREVSRLVLLTRDHLTVDTDLDGRILLEADLAILGAPKDRYRRYVSQVRQEYKHVPDGQWVRGRLKVLTEFLNRDSLFTLPRAKNEWQENAVRNLTWETSSLQDQL